MVFDASAVLAMINGEPGADKALSLLDDRATVSVVNAGEIVGKLVARGIEPVQAWSALQDVDLDWIAPDPGQARRVGELGAVKNLSLADRFCIALGEARGEPIVTADRDWRHVPIRVPVEFIR